VVKSKEVEMATENEGGAAVDAGEGTGAVKVTGCPCIYFLDMGALLPSEAFGVQACRVARLPRKLREGEGMGQIRRSGKRVTWYSRF
jgi:hypothetical protein